MLAAFTLVRYRRFTGRTAFSGMVSAPLVMPEVVVGLSLLLMLVSIQRAVGFPERGNRLDVALLPRLSLLRVAQGTEAPVDRFVH
jgi:ABC-type spermidine/putrescine transport system permease subunit II